MQQHTRKEREPMDLFSPVTDLRGVGPARAAALQRLGIFTLYDLLAYFPRDYEDRTNPVEIAQLQPGVPACFEALVVSQPVLRRIGKGRDVTNLTVADETGKLTLHYFNQPYIKTQLHYGQSYYFYGTLLEHGMQMANPAFEESGRPGTVTNRLLPVYPLTAGLSNRTLCACIRQAFSAAGALPELLPETVREQYGLCGVTEAYTAVHAPESWEALQSARKRLVFEEFFIFSAGLAVLRASRTELHTIPYDTACMDAFFRALPFRLTGAQSGAIDQILRDLSSGHVMNRLVQGDVGSGKTMVAAAACFCAVKNGKQAAFMAPTEILAEQHEKTLSALLGPLGVHVLLLTGAKTPAQKRAAREKIASGESQLIVGTHALISTGVEFHALGLVVADEQHRFGVAQRTRLTEKGDAPHLLVMSATPIPRTLALIAYGDLDVSVIAELPPGRRPVETFLVSEALRERLNGFIRKQCAGGHQVYVVCPAVEDGEENTMKSAEGWAQTLRDETFPELRVGLVHGRMKSAEKDAALSAFRAGDYDILVATTVVEVGVDVPNATLMVIENAERFGLSQLHQLRGRVGRGSAQSYCVLVSGTKNEETKKRLQALCKTTDGFKIAEQDLALRGPGDFFGSRQHGLPLLKVASLQMDLETLRDAQQAAAAVIQTADSLNAPELAPLKARVEALFTRQEVSLN
ncbi:MAG: ATP-dependent DNA helicase RecG [Oscillospiraceae bacterium]